MKKALIRGLILCLLLGSAGVAWTARPAHAGRGTSPSLQAMSRIASPAENGVVRGVVKGQRIALVFSDDLPAPCRQQLRTPPSR